MRTYTVKRWRDAERELVVDMVLHIDEGGHSGPAAQWAIDAVPGSRLHLIGPRRGMSEGSRGAIEFERGNARELLLAGDETAVPAILNILDHLADLDEEGVPVRGRALLEVPCVDDELAVRAPDGVEVHWLPREGAEVGTLLEPAVHEAVAADAALLAEVRDARASDSSDDAREELPDVDVDQVILWEVPHVLTAAAHGSGTEVAEEDRPFYAWIAGEAGVIKRLRRYLVREVGVDRRQVAFMGYWRQGRAEN
jgi:NADPH-dependent ferric siderophore reductase